jgi:chromosomal replication initiator protein
MSCAISQLHAINVDGQKLGPFTRPQLVELRREISKTLCVFSDYVAEEEEIIQTVCDFFQITREGMMGRLRTEKLAWPRQVAMYFVRRMTRRSLHEVGRLFKRDHGTVMHAINTVENRCQTRQFNEQVAELSAKLEAK